MLGDPIINLALDVYNWLSGSDLTEIIRLSVTLLFTQFFGFFKWLFGEPGAWMVVAQSILQTTINLAMWALPADIEASLQPMQTALAGPTFKSICRLALYVLGQVFEPAVLNACIVSHFVMAPVLWLIRIGIYLKNHAWGGGSN